MTSWRRRAILPLTVLALVVGTSCGTKSEPSDAGGVDAEVGTLGAVEVTAKLVEIPAGSIFKRDLYDYAAVLKYEVVKVHRGKLDAETIYVAHYNPFKPRGEAADRRVKRVGGDLKRFEAGQVHRMALEVPLDDYFMGGLINKYFGTETGPLYWAVWTNLAGG
jgi:hypothetical protein